jgi:hypothetical protein
LSNLPQLIHSPPHLLGAPPAKVTIGAKKHRQIWGSREILTTIQDLKIAALFPVKQQLIHMQTLVHQCISVALQKFRHKC